MTATRRSEASAPQKRAADKAPVIRLDEHRPDNLEERLAALLARIAAADRAALAQFYDLTVNRVYAVARNICHDEAKAEEAVEEIYLSVWRQAQAVSPCQTMRWLLKLTRDAALIRARPHLAAGADLIAMIDPRSAMHQALRGLTARQRSAVNAAFFGGTLDDVARLLSTTRAAAAALLRCGLKKISGQ